MLRQLRQLLWIERLFVAVIGVTIALILAGPFVVPATLDSPRWVGSTLGDVVMQLALAAVAFAGPWSFRRQQRSIGISAALGLLFAAVYVGVIVLEFQGVQTGVNIVALFVGVAFMAGAAVTYRTRHWLQGLLAAIWSLLIGTALWSVAVLLINYVTWGSHQQYGFWLADGAVDEFRRGGDHDFNAFLLEDIHGALFFHPLVGIVLGSIGGLVGSSAAQGVVALRRLVGPRVRAQG